MDSAHRRVELQSAADMTYLMANAKRAARAKIDLHLPPSAAPEGGEDVLRRRVEELVDEYIRNVFASARQGISVNGIESSAAAEAEEVVTEGMYASPSTIPFSSSIHDHATRFCFSLPMRFF